jgi:hypothetical protein
VPAQQNQNSSSWINNYSFTNGSGNEIKSSPLYAIGTRDGGFLLNNYSINFRRQTSSILKLDSMGNPIWQKVYACNCYFSDMIEIQGGYIAAVNHNVNGIVSNSYILKLNQQGNIVWAKSFQLKPKTLIQRVIQTVDGGYFAAFVVGDTGLNEQKTWVIKLTSQGTIEWQYLYNVPWPTFVAQLANKDFVLITTRVGLLRISPSGEIKYQVRYFGPNCCWFAQAKRLPNDDLVVLASFLYGEGTFVLKLDSVGSVVMSELLYRERPIDIAPVDDGTYRLLTFSDTGDLRFRTRISKLNRSGNVVWQRQLQTGEISYPQGLIKAADGGFLVITWGDHNSPTSSDWVLKLNSSGNIVNPCRDFLTNIPAVTRDTRILVEPRMPNRFVTSVIAKTINIKSENATPRKHDYCSSN